MAVYIHHLISLGTAYSHTLGNTRPSGSLTLRLCQHESFRRFQRNWELFLPQKNVREP